MTKRKPTDAFPARSGFAAALLLSMAACASAPSQPEPPSLRVLSGAEVADTVTAALAQPLVVELRDRGAPQAGVEVHLAASTASLAGADHPTVFLAPHDVDEFTGAATAVTDAQGRAQVRVVLGRVAGEGSVSVSAPSLAVSAIASYTVRPGAPVSLSVTPADTAVTAGGSYALRISAPDRFGNAVPPSYLPGSAAVSASGGSVSGIAPGRTSVQVQAGGRSVTVQVSVVPAGTLLAAGPDGIYTFGTDGSGFRRVLAQGGARSPRWLQGGEGFVYSIGLSHAHVADLDGSTRRLVPSSDLQAELWAHPSGDGAWVYFGGYSGWEFRGYPYRVRPDGSDLQLVPGFTPDDVTQAHPSSSPDGTRLAYFREEGDSRNVVIRILDMSTGAVTGGIAGHSPEWSHGDSIAYLDTRGDDRGPIRLMASDGTGRRVVAEGPYGFGFDWSPDDRWIVARNVSIGRLEVVEVRTGLRIPLPYSAGLFDPAWKP